MRWTAATSGACLLLMAALVGCQLSVNDLPSEAQCAGSGGRDRCGEPVCWYYASCRAQSTRQAAARSDAGSSTLVPNLSFDAGGALPAPSDDAGSVARDASALQPPALATCGTPPVTCNQAETCSAGQCTPISGLPGNFAIQIKHAYVPLQYSATVCFDPICNAVPVPAGICTCQPDPVVRVLVDGVLQLPTSSVQNDTITPTWTSAEPTVHVHLSATSVIRFEVYDDDSVEHAPAQFMFACAPSLADLPIGVLQCSPRHEDVLPLLGTDPYPYEVTANISRALVQ